MTTDPARTKEKLDAIASMLDEAAHSMTVAVNNLRELAEYYK